MHGREYLHIQVHTHAYITPTYDAQSTIEIRGFAEPGTHHFEKSVGLESPQVNLLGLQMYATTPSFSVGPGDLNLGLMLVHETYWSISTQPIICFEIRSHRSSEWPGTQCVAHSGLKLMTILLSQPSGMASAIDTQL